MSTRYQTITIQKIQALRESEVMLFGCSCHTYEDAVESIMAAVKCSELTAVRYVETAKQFREVVVFHGLKEDCEKVASILSCTGLDVSVIS